MTGWLGHGPLGSPGSGYSYAGLVLVPFNVHERTTNATSLVVQLGVLQLGSCVTAVQACCEGTPRTFTFHYTHTTT